jgi:hypothetical protein
MNLRTTKKALASLLPVAERGPESHVHRTGACSRPTNGRGPKSMNLADASIVTSG